MQTRNLKEELESLQSKKGLLEWSISDTRKRMGNMYAKAINSLGWPSLLKDYQNQLKETEDKIKEIEDDIVNDKKEKV